MNQGELTAVKVSFRPEQDGGTRITLTHTGWKDTEAYLQAREWHVDAWRGMLASSNPASNPVKAFYAANKTRSLIPRALPSPVYTARSEALLAM